MSESWQDLSEIVVGLELQGRLSTNAVCAEKLIQPYDQIAKLLKEGKELEEIIGKVGLSPVQTAMDAAKSLNGLGEKANWIALLETSYSRHDIGSKLEKYGKILQRGNEVDWSKVIELGNNLVNKKSGLVPLSSVEPGEVPFIKTGWKAIDNHLGGIPGVGVITVGGNPGVGKTSFAIKLSSRFVHKHKTKKVAVFTLEMILSEYVTRALEVDNTLTDEEKSRILVCDEVLTVNELVNKASLIDGLGLIVIDFADLLIPGEVTEPEMATIYKSLAAASKRLGVPVVLLAQLSRSYNGGLPRPFNLRYTALAEALSWMILMLYAPSRDYFADEKKKGDIELPVTPGKAYILCWKCRGGFRIHKEAHDHPGAVQLNWRGEQAWSDGPGNWFSLTKGHAVDDDEDDDD